MIAEVPKFGETGEHVLLDSDTVVMTASDSDIALASSQAELIAPHLNDVQAGEREDLIHLARLVRNEVHQQAVSHTIATKRVIYSSAFRLTLARIYDSHKRLDLMQIGFREVLNVAHTAVSSCLKNLGVVDAA